MYSTLIMFGSQLPKISQHGWRPAVLALISNSITESIAHYITDLREVRYGTMESAEQPSTETPQVQVQAQVGAPSSPATTVPTDAAPSPLRRSKRMPVTVPMANKHEVGQRGGAGALSVRSMNFNIPTNQGTHNHAAREHGADSWRYKALHFLHSSKIQTFFMGLLMADVIILFLELLFLATYPHCSIIERDAISCCPSPSTTDAETVSVVHENLLLRQRLRWLEDEQHDAAHDFCDVSSGLSSFQDYPAACDEHKWQAVHTTEEVLFALTVTILCIFSVELNVSMVALTPQIFFRQFFFLLDYVIITVSLALEREYSILYFFSFLVFVLS